MKKILLLLSILFTCIKIQAQTDEEIKIIQSATNVKTLKEMSIAIRERSEKNRNLALEYAKIYGWEIIKYKADGGVAQLMGITDDKKPIYYETLNYGAGLTTRANKLYTGGGLGLNIHGESMTVGVWDASGILLTHEAFENRALQMDFAPITVNHSTHVSGTLIASDQFQNGLARGMAFKANLHAYDWYDDLNELTVAAGQGLLLSNHSYVMGNYTSTYDYTASYLDQVMYNAPYYMCIAACGNLGGPAYDKLNGGAVTKNGIGVANVEEVANYTGPQSVVIAYNSSYGPSDDGRIKPDLCAKGVAVWSTNNNPNNSTYNYGWGTSMASPGITGTLLLLQQYYHSVFNNFCRSSTLKGLAIHTADEAGANPGPDIIYGWGLMNAGKAAQVIMNSNISSLVLEKTLNNGQTYSKYITANGTEPLVVTLCWTDVPGIATFDNDPTARLINDLDIRVTNTSNNTVNFPWKLDQNNINGAALQADNDRDNVEKIEIPNPVPGQTYLITITHKGTLDVGTGGGIQNYSLIVSGITVQPCLSNISITGAYSAPFTESGTWIKAIDQTTIAGTGSVILDAHNVNGYIEISPVSSTDFFLSSPTTGVFIAQPLDGCGDLVPSFPGKNKPENRPVKYYTLPVTMNKQTTAISSFMVFPNPADEIFTITTPEDINKSTVKVFNNLGQLQNISIQDIDSHSKKIKLMNGGKGIYLIQLTTNTKIETGKIFIY